MGHFHPYYLFYGDMTKAELIKKFLDNCCTEDEARLAMQHLEAEPSLLDEVLTKSDWDNTDHSAILPPQIELEMRKGVMAQTRKPVFRMGKTVLKAAAMVSGIVLGLMVLYISTRNTIDGNSYAAVSNLAEATKKIYNTTSVNKEIVLADNSRVSLFPGSSLEYNPAFKERTIKLEGKAIFTVTKNMASRFVVYSGAITTTALGTRFLVDNNAGDININVKLYEGKVVVESAEPGVSLGKTFLEAGQQCFINLNTMLVKIEAMPSSGFIASKKTLPAGKVKNANTSKVIAGGLVFSKTPLREVVDNLQIVFNQPLGYNKNEIAGRHFTGSFTTDDSLTAILKMIAVMNDLSVNTDGVNPAVVKSPRNILTMDANIGSVYKLALVEQLKLDPIAPEPRSTATAGTNEQPVTTIVSGESATHYTRIPLSALISELQKQTQRKIYFNTQELAHINFTGSIPFDETVRNTLTTLCRINGLTLIVKKRGYYISITQ